jgi:hypothetical protein
MANESGVDIMLLQSDQIETIRRYHNSITGHAGIDRTYRAMTDAGVQWPSLRDDLTSYIQRCAICQKSRAALGRPAAALRHITIERPFESFSFDAVHIGENSDDDGYEWLLVAIDEMSRFVEARPVRSLEGTEGFDFFLELMSRYGHPASRIRVDGHGQFVNRISEEYCRFVGIELSTATPRHHKSNGRIERAHRDILERLRVLAQDKPSSGSRWSRNVKFIVQSHNHAVCWTTGVAPTDIIYAGQVKLNPFPKFPSRDDIARKPPMKKVSELYMETLHRDANRIRERAIAHEKKYFKRIATSDDHPANEVIFDVGDWVLYKRSAEIKAEVKILPPWIGPWVVVEKKHDLRYVIRDPNDSSKTREVNVNSLKLFLPPVDTTDAQLPLLRQNLAAQDDRGFIVESIISHTYNDEFRDPKSQIKNGFRFRVRWKGYGESEDDHLPYSELANTEAMVEYLKDKPLLNKVLRRRNDPTSQFKLAKDKKL